MEETVTAELLKNKSETMQQEEVMDKMLDEEVMMTREEQRERVEVTTFLKVKDPSHPLNVNPSSSFTNLVINDPKDIEMLDQGITDHNNNSTHSSKAEAMVEPVTKDNLGSNMSHLAEPLSPIKTSAADIDEKEKEEKEKDSETEELEVELEVEEVDVEVDVEVEVEDMVEADKVEIIEEVSSKEVEVVEVILYPSKKNQESSPENNRKRTKKGFVNDRNISDAKRGVYNKIVGIMMAIDFRKAFDSIAFSFIKAVLQFFKFSKSLMDGIMILLNLYKQGTSLKKSR